VFSVFDSSHNDLFGNCSSANKFYYDVDIRVICDLKPIADNFGFSDRKILKSLWLKSSNLTEFKRELQLVSEETEFFWRGF